jgi:hypothetical protein
MIRLPRKQKKKFKKVSIKSFRDNLQSQYNWIFRNRMVIVHNYIIGGIPINLTAQDEQFIKTGLLTNKSFKITYEKFN